MMSTDEEAGRDDLYWIVILRNQSGGPLPMHHGENVGRFEVFHTKADAFRAGRENPLGAIYGFKVIRWGYA